MKLAVAAAIAAGIGCIAGSAAVLALRALPPPRPEKFEPVWSEAGWPFPQDQWNAGRAFVCQQADCGARIDVFLRPKIGFCNCSTGVSDDTELERVSDTALLAQEVVPIGSGRPIKVAWMDGRSRAYRSAAGPSLLSVAFNDECDAVVAVGADRERRSCGDRARGAQAPQLEAGGTVDQEGAGPGIRQARMVKRSVDEKQEAGELEVTPRTRDRGQRSRSKGRNTW